MANLKITDLAALTNPVSTDVLPIVDVAGDATKKVTIADLLENAGAGSASSPSFSFDGDSDTGLYRSSANKLTITTAGTERVTVDSNGDLGINTLFPSYKLDVRTDANYAALFRSSNNATGIIFQDSGSSVGGVSIGSIGDDFVIRRGLTSAELLRVDTAGNVGIDTSSPGAKFHVAGGNSLFEAGTGQGTVNIVSTENGSNAGNKIAFFAADRFDTDEEMAYIQPLLVNNNGGSGNVQSGALAFGTSGSEKMRIDSSGNVGIGTSSPGGKLHSVGGTANGINVAGVFTGGTSGGAGAEDTDEVQLRLSTNNANAGIRGAWISALNTTGANQGHDLLFYTNPTASTPVERMRITHSGNCGIGATNPGVKLVVAGTDAIQVPAGTTAQRPTAAAGQIRLNTTHGYFEGYDGTNWTNLRTLVQTYIASGTQSCDNTSFSAISVIDNNQSLSDSLTTESGGIYTFARAGIYEVYIGITVEGSATNYRWTGQLVATKNGTSTIVGQTKGGYIRDSVGSTETFLNMTFIHEFAAGNTVRFRIKRISDISGTATIQSSTLSNVIIKALKTTD